MRNSVVRLCDFCDKTTEEFNNAEFLPESKCLLDLHKHFSESIELPLGNYIMTKDKAKDTLSYYTIAKSVVLASDKTFACSKVQVQRICLT